MYILVDVGNTACKFALLNKGKLDFVGRLFNSDVSLTKLKEMFSSVNSVKGIYISSVNPKIKEIVMISLKEITGIEAVVIDNTFFDSSFLKIDNKEELGVDLYCDLLAAKKEYKNEFAIIDLGTATKILFVDKEGNFSSCAIFLGYQKSKEILSNSTALLPNVKRGKIKPISECHNTIDVIDSSAYFSHIDSINGIIMRHEKDVGYSYKRIYTGGNFIDFKDEFYKENYDEYLVLKGIAIIIESRENNEKN